MGDRKSVGSEQDLDGLVIGDQVRVSLEHGFKRPMIYEGQINGQDAFIERNESRGGIMSWRSYRQYLSFDDGTVQFDSFHRNHGYYPVGSQECTEKEPLLVES
ncbi:MAG: hypothetical protein CMH61_01425 [Nanoarchaeota archaeon]|nr:hypothetical protein [Nanoarchaeota archaeon]|tara:strand:+ start:743 stop:1051 length:309 start_codon:yes stop_codon:yes gene_type:complete